MIDGSSSVGSAEVRLYANADPDRSAEAWRTLQSVRVDANGIATLSAIRGKHLVAARAADGRVGRAVFDNPGDGLERTFDVQVSAPVDLALELRDAGTKEPVSLARVHLLQKGLTYDSKWDPSLPPDERVESTADTRGAWHARGLPPGRYQLSVSADGYEPWRSEVLSCSSPAVLRRPERAWWCPVLQP